MQTCSNSVYGTCITVKVAGYSARDIWTTGWKPYIVPYTDEHISMNRTGMTIGCPL